MTTSTDQNQHIHKLRGLIQDIGCGMLTTVDEDGSLHSRPMDKTSDIQSDGTIWFFTNASTHKVFEIEHRQHVNISFTSPNEPRYVSISGIAELVKDRNKMQELWKPELQAWFPQGLDESDIALLKVKINRADYWDSQSSFQQQTINF
ncbi:pyridoxamine 5'-phosphate oxidase family protein [Nostoc sp. 106C]|uniref:pyridoxamine 5'-phosphate oxidase family protein n=1 Tax=Nostoc sp. 106C TaxID=1932667 RepID=UPI000A3D31FB|nr:pyridoxamine 5'-phosphate oxidase family protein [Nostoc sp. 106C]OUL30754.1 pyridoxamine 5'-phosphate oxidase [Nostoc sp. RF31YmG]OUL35168.1 pyridoxamine 5'-phosphate oxidase [Nostoc sp. 106C]